MALRSYDSCPGLAQKWNDTDLVEDNIAAVAVVALDFRSNLWPT